MRARAKPQAAYNADPAKGRPLLPAAKAVEVFIEELLQWAALMPLFATRLTGHFARPLFKAWFPACGLSHDRLPPSSFYSMLRSEIMCSCKERVS